MVVEYKINDSNLIYEVWVGQLDRDEIIRTKIKSKPNSPAAKVIVDATYASFDHINVLDIREFIELYFSSRDINAGAQMAVICPNDFSKALVLQKFAADHLIDTIVFSSLDIACVWLGLDNSPKVYEWINTTRSKLIKYKGKKESELRDEGNLVN